jgi:hypothetical protein
MERFKKVKKVTGFSNTEEAAGGLPGCSILLEDAS